MNKLEPSEAEFQDAVVQLAEMCGWRTMHVRRSIDGHDGRWRTVTSIAGWPDVVLWRPGAILHRELKTDDGRLTRQQRAVLDSLAEAGADVAVWRPADWSAIESTLRPVR